MTSVSWPRWWSTRIVDHVEQNREAKNQHDDTDDEHRSLRVMVSLEVQAHRRQEADPWIHCESTVWQSQPVSWQLPWLVLQDTPCRYRHQLDPEDN